MGHERFIATNTKRALLSRVIEAVVAFLCPLFFIGMRLYLNVDVAIFYAKVILEPTKKNQFLVILVQQAENLPSTREGCFFAPSLTILLPTTRAHL